MNFDDLQMIFIFNLFLAHKNVGFFIFNDQSSTSKVLKLEVKISALGNELTLQVPNQILYFDQTFYIGI